MDKVREHFLRPRGLGLSQRERQKDPFWGEKRGTVTTRHVLWWSRSWARTLYLPPKEDYYESWERGTRQPSGCKSAIITNHTDGIWLCSHLLVLVETEVYTHARTHTCTRARAVCDFKRKSKTFFIFHWTAIPDTELRLVSSVGWWMVNCGIFTVLYPFGAVCMSASAVHMLACCAKKQEWTLVAVKFETLSWSVCLCTRVYIMTLLCIVYNYFTFDFDLSE